MNTPIQARRRRDIELGEIHPVLHQLGNIWRANGGVTIVGVVSVSTVIEEEYDNIGLVAACRAIALTSI